MKRRLIFLLQFATLRLSFAWHRVAGRGPKIAWVVGPYEIARLVHDIAMVLPSSESVVLRKHPFYDVGYSWQAPPVGRGLLADLRVYVRGPWKLGELAVRADGFVYISQAGFIDSSWDERWAEFQFLKRRGKRIVCYFTGTDIRSPRRMAELEDSMGEPNVATYLAETDGRYATESYEIVKQRTAASAERFADVIFNADADQRGYLTQPAEHFKYFVDDEDITETLDKFENVKRPVVLHAPSSPVIKGTQLVRAAVAQLQAEGWDFEYVELVRQPHESVQRELRRAHIVLNQFYSLVPGVFGVEALAAGNVVMMRADENDEPSVPAGSNSAWVVTRHHQVANNLRQLLSNPSLWEEQARAGVAWVRQHAASSVTGPEFARVLETVRASART